MKRIFTLFFVVFLLNSLLIAGSKNSLQVKGSDTMVNLAQAWAEKYMEKNPKEFIAVTGGGSGTGFSSLFSKTCHIAMSSRTIKTKEIALAKKRGVFPYEIKVALDGIVVVVHPKNPVSKLTLDQLAQIFSGQIKNWKEVGGVDKKIVLLSREVNSGTHVYFKEHVLRRNDPVSKVEFAPNALLLSSSQAIAEEVANNTEAIGYYGMGYMNPKQKVLSISMNEKSGYVVPNLQNVTNGKYPISRPLYVYTNQAPTGLTKKFIDFALSPEGQKIVVAIDFVPIR